MSKFLTCNHSSKFLANISQRAALYQEWKNPNFPPAECSLSTDKISPRHQTLWAGGETNFPFKTHARQFSLFIRPGIIQMRRNRAPACTRLFIPNCGAAANANEKSSSRTHYLSIHSHAPLSHLCKRRRARKTNQQTRKCQRPGLMSH